MRKLLAIAIVIGIIILGVASVALADRPAQGTSRDLPARVDPELAPDAAADDAPVAPAQPASDVTASYNPAIARPGIYIFYDQTYLNPAEYPGIIAGGHMTFQWKNLETSPGYYDWSRIDDFLTAQALLGKAAGLEITTYEGVSGGNVSPSWIPIISCVDPYSGAAHPIPNYWSSTYRTNLHNLINAFGQRYNNDPRVEWVEIGAGAYGENQPSDDRYDNCLINAGYGDQTAWENYVKDTIAWTRSAFPSKPLMTKHYPRFRGDSERVHIADYAAPLNVGFKGDGLVADDAKVTQRIDPSKSYYLSYKDDPALTYSNTVPIGFETYRFYLKDDTLLYWGILNGLDKHAHYFNLDKNLMKDLGGGTTNWPTLRFAARYLGQDVYSTPEIWVALRESGMTFFPQNGNYGFYLYQDDLGSGGRTVALTYRAAGTPNPPVGNYDVENTNIEVSQTWLGTFKESWICRRTDAAHGNPFMYFNVDDRYLFGGSNPVSMTVTYFDRGTDTWALEYDSADGDRKSAGTVTKTGTNQWKKITFNLSDARFEGRQSHGNDFRINSNGDGDEIIHMVMVKRMGDTPPTVTLTPTSTVTGTPPTMTPTRTVTPTPTNTVVPTVVCFQEGTSSYVGTTDAAISGYTPTLNQGGSSLLYLKSDGQVSSVIRFDTTSIPSTRIVTNARLRLFAHQRDKAFPLFITSYQLLRSWEEMQVTWNLARTGQSWASAGAQGIGVDRAFDASDQKSVDGQDVWVELDVTGMAAQWVNNPSSNYGVLLTGSGPVTLQYNIYSSESAPGVAVYRPQLCISYVPAPPATSTPTQTSTPSQTPTVTVVPTATPTPTATLTPTPTFTITPTPTETLTPTVTQTPTVTHTPTVTNTPTNTPTHTSTPTITRTPTPTATNTPSTGGIEGFVWHDLNGNGIKEEGEPGLSGATLMLKTSSRMIVQTFVTGSLGSFTFWSLPPGTYILSRINPAGFSSTTPDEWWIRVAPNYTMRVNYGAWRPPTPTPTLTRTPTPILTSTPTGTTTSTSTATRTASATLTRTSTATSPPTLTLTATRTTTRTQTSTPSPSRTATPTQTQTLTPTPTVTLPRTTTPTATLTSTATGTPTQTPWPAGQLDLTDAVQVTCGGIYPGDTRGGPSHADVYPCISSWPEAGPERVFILTTDVRQDITATLSYSVTTELDIFILSGPYTSQCIPGGYGDQYAVLRDAAPGTYYIVVDTFTGFGQPAPGSFNLRIQCSAGPFPTATPTRTPTATETVIPTATPTVTQTATPSRTPTGTLPATPTHTATPSPTPSPTRTATPLPSATPSRTLTPSITLSPTLTPSHTATPTASRTSTPSVSPTASRTGTVTPTAPPAGQLDLTGAEQIACGVSYVGNTTAGPTRADVYSCMSSWPEAGPERVYILTTTARQDITVTVSYLPPTEVDVFILNAPNANSCVPGGYGDTYAVVRDAPAGTYYIVVDTFTGFGDPEPGLFTLRVQCPLGPFPTVTPSRTPTATLTPTRTPTFTPTPLTVRLPLVVRVNPRPTATATRTSTRTPTRTLTPSVTPTPSTLVLQQGVNGYAGVLDTWISTWDGTRNYEGEPLMTFRGGDRDRMSMLVRFDLTNLPADAHIVEARLSLYAVDVVNPGGTWSGSYAIRRPWVANQVTWVDARSSDPWGSGGANLPPGDRSADASSTVFVEGEEKWFEWDITAFAQEWSTRAKPNYGVIIRCPGLPVSANVEHNFVTSENPQTTLRPKLTLRYW
jgi:hypothetical protein